MDPRLRQFLATAICAVLAVWLGWKLAEGEYFWPGLFGMVAAGATLVRLLRLPADVIFLGCLIIGYVVGNRGFAQLMPAPGIPLLPAEAGLLIAGGWALVNAAFSRRLPFVFDALNWAVLAWLVVGTARVLFDVPRFGFVALRDYATVYYAAFFFITQEIARDAGARRYLLGCAVVACVLLALVFPLYQLAPQFFLRHLTVHGIPLVFYKGDLLNTQLAIGSLLLFFCLPARLRAWSVLASVGMFVWVAGGDNRASLVGLAAASLALVLARRWRFPLLQGGVAATALLVVVGLAAVTENAWAERKLAGLADRAASLTDFQGVRPYQSAESGNKGDNNRFRLIWWRNVLEEAWRTNPAFGLGFGSDLASNFLQEYYPEADEEFSARSPHNIFITVFGRMGATGLAAWLILLALLARRGWHTLRHQEDPAGWALWCALLVTLVSASFGVVLEGPMGAVPFWILAGLAVARQRAFAENPADTPAASVSARTPALAARGA